MGVFDRIAKLRSSEAWQTLEQTASPRWIVQVTGCRPLGGRKWEIDVLAYTGDESPWLAPTRRTIKTRAPEGVEPSVGMLLVVKEPRGEFDEPKVLWDRPEPMLPPMKFPNVPGGDDPERMIQHLESLVQSGALDEDGLARARDYLQRGGWPPVT